MSTANRMAFPAPRVSSRVSTYIPPWGVDREPEMAPDCCVHQH